MPTAKHVRAVFNGQTIADSRDVMVMVESLYEVHYYFPKADVRMDLLEQSEHTESSGYRGTAEYYNLTVGDKTVENAVWHYPEAKEKRPDLRDYVSLVWNKMDAWYEEDEEVFVHAKNPFVRIDTLDSKRHIRVEVDGETVADTKNAVILFETGLPARYYIPQADVKMDLLTPTALHTSCPYKGTASYWSVTVDGNTHEDVVWGYPDPFHEVDKIKDLVSFYNEKLDIYIDGELEERPRTKFS